MNRFWLIILVSLLLTAKAHASVDGYRNDFQVRHATSLSDLSSIPNVYPGAVASIDSTAGGFPETFVLWPPNTFSCSTPHCVSTSSGQWVDLYTQIASYVTWASIPGHLPWDRIDSTTLPSVTCYPPLLCAGTIGALTEAIAAVSNTSTGVMPGITGSNVVAMSKNGTSIVYDSISNAQVSASAAIDPSKIAACANGYGILSNGTTNACAQIRYTTLAGYGITDATPSSRTITCTAPLRCDGGNSADLSANRTLSITAATQSAAGSMSPADKTKVDAVPPPSTIVTTEGGTTNWFAMFNSSTGVQNGDLYMTPGSYGIGTNDSANFGSAIGSMQFYVGSTYYNGTNWITPGVGSNAISLITGSTSGIDFFTASSIGPGTRTTSLSDMDTYLRRMRINDSGVAVTGILSATGELSSTAANGLRIIQGSYDAVLRNDGSTTSLQMTASGGGNVNPFIADNATGNLGIKVAPSSDALKVGGTSYLGGYVTVVGGANISGQALVDAPIIQGTHGGRLSRTLIISPNGSNYGANPDTSDAALIDDSGTLGAVSNLIMTATPTYTTVTGSSAAKTLFYEIRILTTKGACTGNRVDVRVGSPSGHGLVTLLSGNGTPCGAGSNFPNHVTLAWVENTWVVWSTEQVVEGLYTGDM